MLTKMEDELLAMCEGDFITMALAIKIMRAWHAKRISKSYVICMLYRLSKLNLIRWHFKVNKKHYFNNTVAPIRMKNKNLTFTATKAGLSYLQNNTNNSNKT